MLLVLVDMDDCDEALRKICNIACMSDFTAILAWTSREAARYGSYLITTYSVK